MIREIELLGSRLLGGLFGRPCLAWSLLLAGASGFFALVGGLLGRSVLGRFLSFGEQIGEIIGKSLFRRRDVLNLFTALCRDGGLVSEVYECSVKPLNCFSGGHWVS